MPERTGKTPPPPERPSLVEYSLLLSLVALVGMTIVTALQEKVPGALFAAVLR
jgi:hypothetical protein